MKTKLWRVVGASKGGNSARMTVRAADYFAARSKAKSYGMATIRELVLIEEPTSKK